MILSGLAVQTNGFGLWLAFSMKRLMAVWRSTMDRKSPRLRRRLAKKVSTALSQEQEVDVGRGIDVEADHSIEHEKTHGPSGH